MITIPGSKIGGGGADVIIALLEARTGQRLDAGRAWRIESAVKPLLRERGLRTTDELVALMLSGAEPGLDDIVTDSLLNQETSFFRDAAILELAVRAAEQMEAAAPDRRLRIWCAACSTGQEPLSLAMTFAERADQSGRQMPDIRATDISPRALDRARSGRYTQFEIQRGLPIRRMVRWFESLDDAWVARAELRKHVRYALHNLISDPMPSGTFDLILCRNVLMYLSTPMRRLVLDRLATALRDGGLLLLGAGETLIGHDGALVPSEEYRGFYRLAARC